MNVTVQPALLKWARERASLSVAELAEKVGTKKNPAPIEAWENSETPVELSTRKLELIAEKTRAPLGMLFLPEPPEEPLPIRDLRRPSAGGNTRPSLRLLETIYECQLRQGWLSERMQEDGEEPVAFVGSATINANVAELARSIRETLRIGTEERRRNRTTAETVLWLIGRLEESRITVIRKGFAGTATRRGLDANEFKGFALADRFAPFIFINGKDWPASQVFTVVHECVHLWLGESALPDGDWLTEATNPTERFCNRVAAEVLIPADELSQEWRDDLSAEQNVTRLAGLFKVSSLAMLVRARNSELVSEALFNHTREQLDEGFAAQPAEPESSGGGNYYNNAGIHLGKRFIREVLTRTLEGRTLYSEAFDLLGTRKSSVLQQMAHRFL